MSSTSDLNQDDVRILLSWSRPLQLTAPSMDCDCYVEQDSFARFSPIVPELIFAMMLSLVTDKSRLWRMLSQDWVAEWRGWSRCRAVLENCYDDKDAEEVALTCIQDFGRISLQNVNIQTKSDAARKAELESQGKRIGLGLVHGNNECCADSLLQLLSSISMASPHLAYDIDARKLACSSCRKHLIHHSNENVRPRQRTETGAIADVSDKEHRRAFLQHDVHGEEIVNFFARTYPGTLCIPPEGLILQVYTRWDSAVLPVSRIIVSRNDFADAAGLDEPTVLLEMFNNTGECYTGYHYDPVLDTRHADRLPSDLREPVLARGLQHQAPPELESRATGTERFEMPSDIPSPPSPSWQVADRARKRLRTKTQETAPITVAQHTFCEDGVKMNNKELASEQPEAMQQCFSLKCMDAKLSPDPRCIREAAIKKVAEDLRNLPTVQADPEDPSKPFAAALLEDAGIESPAKHCAFAGCQWTGAEEAELMQHLMEKHRLVLESIAQLYPLNYSLEERIFAAYNSSLSLKAQMAAPLASYAIDRRCMYAYMQGLADDKVDSLICFCCARRFPYVSSFRGNLIRWHQPWNYEHAFQFLDAKCTESFLGYATYLSRYGMCQGTGQPNLRARPEEFEDWLVTVTLKDNTPIELLCCPEDKHCSSCTDPRRCCKECQVPICVECATSLAAKPPRMPDAALSNDMMIFYAPVELYSNDVTVFEMICASACITAMICCTLELKHRKENPLDSELHMARHRMGARGNATTFPLPWSDLFAELVKLDASKDGGAATDLPWTGQQLSDRVSVLLKTFDDEHTEQMTKVIHQALVRRDVVILLIEKAKERGHRSYVNLDMDRVRRKAQDLPSHGVPPELIRLCPHDNNLDKIIVQKSGTPTPGRSDLEGAGKQLNNIRPNAVVLEKSSYDDADINAQRARALHHLADNLGVVLPKSMHSEEPTATHEPCSKRPTKATNMAKCHTEESASLTKDDGRVVVPYVMATGNNLVDQFQPWYFGIAFAFLFKYCTGMPDMYEFAERQRYRRTGNAPRIELARWTQVMARRIEAQLQRDWHFGFASWNLLFRSAINLSRTVYSYESASTGKNKDLITAEELEKGAVALCKALHGKYQDVNGKTQGVRGDMSKLRFVPGLSAAAKRLLSNIEHCSRKIAGTQEIRRLMRFQIQGYRVCYGVPIFVTFSPDESHNM